MWNKLESLPDYSGCDKSKYIVKGVKAVQDYRLYIRLLIAVSFYFIVGCSVFSSRELYSSPHGNFVFPLPESSSLFLDIEAEIQESSDHLGGRVVFDDPMFFGFLTSITYRRLPGDSDGVWRNADERKFAVRGFLHDYALPELFKPVSQDTEVLLEEYIGTGDAVEYFAVVRIPEGATVRNTLGERFDSIRALLIFPHDGYMYMLGFDNMTVLSLILPPKNAAEKIDLVEYQTQSGESAAPGVEDSEETQHGLEVFAAMAQKRLADFKSTIVFK